ncbi:MAG: hypothetical protein HFI22_05485 [Lachnospiraceae bacterium]|jgi:dTDP-4-amino-4,6-dideoxygalactose transaminase|nr:hypothetical protein [Lachnospiraceae bacterium]
MLREIGSNFWMEPIDRYDEAVNITPEMFGIRGSDYTWLSTGRSAISMAIAEAEKKNSRIERIALVPSYTCDTVIAPFSQAGYKVETLGVDEQLCIKGEELLDVVKKANAGIILLHHYFGFYTIPGWEDVKKKIKDLGVVVIEDRTQCLYSSFETLDADYVVGSIRKWHGVPDGGFLVCKEGSLCNKPEESDLILEQAKKEAATLKYNYLYHQQGTKDKFLDAFAKAESILDSQTKRYAISDTSLQMQAGLDTEGLKEKRRQNYAFLLEHLTGMESISFMFPELPKEITPLYCPILTMDRGRIQTHLRNSAVYAPVIWPKSEKLPRINGKANVLYTRMLCIPIDQRYGSEEMRKITECLYRCFE